MIEFDRDIYKNMEEWKNGYKRNKVLFIEGSHQIRKTHVINNFVNKNFKKMIKINLMTDDKEALKSWIDRALYCKENTYGGIDGKKITIPIYLFSKFEFNAVNN